MREKKGYRMGLGRILAREITKLRWCLVKCIYKYNGFLVTM